MTTSLTKQYNFKINESSMEQARAIIKEKGMTMTDANGLKSLETFPEAGFDADEKIGLKINSKYPTRGKIIEQYILLYFIDQTQRTVFLSHLFHTKSDYVTLLQSKNNKNSKSSF